ncbi:hypothetical protein C3V39_02550 [Prevotella sp. oral taxon 820]|nr:hypothetical protein C3V39_02550 [Prevotella sp. oral taxon 820]
MVFASITSFERDAVLITTSTLSNASEIPKCGCKGSKNSLLLMRLAQIWFLNLSFFNQKAGFQRVCGGQKSL